MRSSHGQGDLSQYIRDYRRSVKVKLSSSYRHLNQAGKLAESSGLETQSSRNEVYEEIEAAIYSASSAFDILCQEVSWALDLGLEEKRVSVNAVMTRLGRSAHESHKKLRKMMDDFTGSGLYVAMKDLRNQTTHRSVTDDLAIRIHPWLKAVPEVGSRAFRNVVIIGDKVVRTDKSITLPYRIEARTGNDFLPQDVNGLAVVVWKGYPLFETVLDFLEATSAIVGNVEEVLDN